MLLSGKSKFDVVIANINSPDLHGFKLVQQAVSMGLPIVCKKINYIILFIIIYIYIFVCLSCIYTRTVVSVEDNAFMAMRALESGAFLYIKKPATMEILRYLWQLVMREKTRMIRERELFAAAGINLVGEIMKNEEEEEEEEYSCDSDVRKKMCTEWTHELHAKFMNAVEILGEGSTSYILN